MSAEEYAPDVVPLEAYPEFHEDAPAALPVPAPTTPAASPAPAAPAAIPAAPSLPSATVASADARTDVANGRRFADLFRGRVRYVPEWKQWLIWDGFRWRPDTSLQIQERAKEAVGELYKVAAGVQDREELKRWLGWCHQSAQKRGLEAMLAMARSEEGIPVHASELDQNPWLFGTLNGVIDLRADAPERFRTARPGDLMTKQSVVWYDPEATCPRWEQFVSEICDGDEELVRYLQRALGYSLTGLVREERLFFLWGPGRNGKSKLINAVVELMGDYATTASHDLLLKGQGDTHHQKLASFHGRRLVVAAEVGQGRLDTDLFKQLTGGDMITARRMRENEWSFSPTHTLWMTANNEPVVTEATTAVWERMLKIPLRVVIPPHRRDTELAEKLQREFAGILNWLVAGCLDWQAQGLGSSRAVDVETEQYRQNSDTIGAFIDECLVELDASKGTYSGSIFASYKDWALEQGLSHPVSARKLTQELRGRGYHYEPKWGSAKKGAFLGLGVQSGHVGNEF